MSNFSLVGGFAKVVSHGFDVANVRGVAVTADATANVEGGYSEIVSAADNTFDSDEIEIVIYSDAAGTERGCHITLALGEAGFEHDVTDNMYVVGTRIVSAEINAAVYKFPLKTPSNVRISAKARSTLGGNISRVFVRRGVAGLLSPRGLAGVLTIGADTANSAGTIAPLTSAGAWNGYVELTASLDRPIQGFVIGIGNNNTSWTTGRLAYRIGVGIAGSEKVVYESGLAFPNGNENGNFLQSGFIPVQVAEGQRLAVSPLATGVSGSDFNFGYILYGVY